MIMQPKIDDTRVRAIDQRPVFKNVKCEKYRKTSKFLIIFNNFFKGISIEISKNGIIEIF